MRGNSCILEKGGKEEGRGREKRGEREKEKMVETSTE